MSEVDLVNDDTYDPNDVDECWLCGGKGEVESVCSETGMAPCPDCWGSVS